MFLTSLHWTLVIAIVFLIAETTLAEEPELRRLDRCDAVHVYRRINETNLKLYEFRPDRIENNSKRPAIIFFHGGGWVKGTPASMAPHCRYFAHRGIISLTASYRKAVPNAEPTVHDCLDDARAAIRFVHDHADQLGVNQSRIIVSGGSAGGHLAMRSAMDIDDDQTTPIAACVLFNPATVLTPNEALSTSFNDEMSERRESIFDGRPKLLCPLNAVASQQPPMVMMHGSEDWLLPASELFHKSYEMRGNRADIEIWEGQDHGFYHLGKNHGRNFVETVATADRFLAGLGLIDGKEDVQTFVESAQ